MIQRFVGQRHNSNNHHDCSPFVVDGDCLLVDHEWYTSMPYMVQRVVSSFDVTFGNVRAPHAHTDGEVFRKIYHSHLSSFNFEHWYHPDLDLNAQIVMLSRNDITRLWEVSSVRRMWDGKVPDASEFELCSSVVFDGPKFVKLGSTSGKNERKLRPVHNVDELIDFLTDTHAFYLEYRSCLDRDEPMAVVLQDWIDMSDKEEYRVFVYCGKVTAISRSNRHEIPKSDREEMQTVRDNIVDWYQEKKDLLPKSTCLDMWVDSELTPHLIECNVFGAWSGAGSALFHWIDDWEVLHDGDAVLRY